MLAARSVPGQLELAVAPCSMGGLLLISPLRVGRLISNMKTHRGTPRGVMSARANHCGSRADEEWSELGNKEVGGSWDECAHQLGCVCSRSGRWGAVGMSVQGLAGRRKC